MSFLLLLALAAAAGMAWLLERRLVAVEAKLDCLHADLARWGGTAGGGTPVGTPPEPARGAVPPGFRACEVQPRVRNPLGFKPGVFTAEGEHVDRDARPASQDPLRPGRGAEIVRDIRDLSDDVSAHFVTAREPTEDTATPRGSFETGGEEESGGGTSAPPVDPSAVKSLYARWVRDQARPEEPSGWEVVPLRFVRPHQEHAAHNRDTFALVFPDANPVILNNTRNLLDLDPVRMHRSGQYWQTQ